MGYLEVPTFFIKIRKIEIICYQMQYVVVFGASYCTKRFVTLKKDVLIN